MIFTHKEDQKIESFRAEDELEKHANKAYYESTEANASSSPSGDGAIGENTVQRNLEQRHISMIAIGGTIGTGLFLGMGQALNKGGPLGLILGYMVMGLVVYAMTIALGEMVTMFPVSGSFTHYPHRFVDPALGFAVGWNYWYSMTIAIPSEIIASTIVVEYWKAPVNKIVWIVLFTALSCGINFFGVRWYGETEFVFAAVKVVAVVVLILVGIVIDLGGAPSHDRIGFRHFIEPGPFNQLHAIPGSLGRFLAFWSVFIQASFSYMGTEMVAITAGEAANPRKTVPKAIERVFYRILFFYLGSTLVVGLLVPYTSPQLLGSTGDASSSPFVIAMNRAGITVLPDMINVVILLSAISTASSKLYGGSRVLFGLSKDGMAPRFFSKCNSSGLPIWALLATCSAGALSFMCLNSQAGVAFQWFQNLSAMTGILTWWTVLVSYLFFYRGLKVQGLSREKLHYRAPFQPYASWAALIMLTLIMMISGFETFLKGGWSISDFLANYLTLPIFLGFYLFWKISKRTKVVSAKHVDFVTGTRELNEMDAQEREKEVLPTTKWGKFIDKLL